VEAQDLDPSRVATPRQDGRERVDRAPRQRRVGADAEGNAGCPRAALRVR
jgi:hypothetical protein